MVEEEEEEETLQEETQLVKEKSYTERTLPANLKHKTLSFGNSWLPRIYDSQVVKVEWSIKMQVHETEPSPGNSDRINSLSFLTC